MNISIGNLSSYASERDLEKLFSAFGKVLSITIAYDSFNHCSRGMAVVNMETDSEALSAIQKLNNTVFMGKAMIVRTKAPLTKLA